MTLVEMARLAGVSPAVVSKVLHGGAKTVRVGAETRERIIRLASEHGYRRNLAASSMRRGAFGCASLVLSAEVSGRSSTSAGLLRGIATRLEEAHMHLSVASLPDTKLTSEQFVPRILKESMADGLLVNYNKQAPPMLAELIVKHSIPAVWLNCKRQSDCVYPNDFQGGYQAVEHLLGLGHRRIAFVNHGYSHEDHHYSDLDRRDGALQAMREAGLKPWAVDRYDMPDIMPDRVPMARRLLSGPDRPTGIVTVGGSTASPFLLAAAGMGLRVPQDLSIVTLHSEAAFIGVAVTTVLVPDEQVGRSGVEMLLEKIRVPGEPLAPVAVPCGGIVRGSTTAAGPQP